MCSADCQPADRKQDAADGLAILIALALMPFVATGLGRFLFFAMYWWFEVLGIKGVLPEERQAWMLLAGMFAVVAAVSFCWFAYTLSRLLFKMPPPESLVPKPSATEEPAPVPTSVNE